MIGKTRKVKVICVALTFLIALAIVVYTSKIYPEKKEKRYSGSDLIEEDVKIYSYSLDNILSLLNAKEQIIILFPMPRSP